LAGFIFGDPMQPQAAIRKLHMPANGSLEQVPILVVEDEPDMAREIAAQLTSLGYLARIAETGAAGLETARRDRAALLIVDRTLNGIDSLAMIETQRKEGIRSPVLVVSALASVDELIRGLKAGGGDYLIKPFAMDELAARDPRHDASGGTA
jgi:two-component system, OmpR family, response regulator